MNTFIKPGDRVRVVKPGMSFDDYTIGDTAVVTKNHQVENLFYVRWETNLLKADEGARCDVLNIKEVEVIERKPTVLAALADAAKPFAGLLQDHNDVKPNGQPYPDSQIVFAINHCEITVGQLRRLKAALATCTEGAHESLSDRPG